MENFSLKDIPTSDREHFRQLRYGRRTASRLHSFLLADEPLSTETTLLAALRQTSNLTTRDVR